MLKDLVDIVCREVSGGIAFDYVSGIARHHRIQASPGYRAAAEWCAARLEEAGLKTEVLRYPARFDQRYWGETMFEEWSCREATLDLVAPAREARRLADFRANPTSVIQRSTATPPEGIEAPVVAVDNADDPASYRDSDVAGKFVLFTGEAQAAYELAVVERGAVGLVTDQMAAFPPVRPAYGLPGATAYTSFWPAAPFPRPAIGFVLSPSEGANLRRLLRGGLLRESGGVGVSGAAAGQGAAGSSPVVLRARVDASLYPGELENVTAVIPGAAEVPPISGAVAPSGGPAGGLSEEVLLVAHLCHPKPSANDNASGVGALIEVARVLASLIAGGRLPRPRRTIRFLLVPEMTGTYAYLATNEETIARIVAALNLDMVGENQDLTGSPLRLEAPPLACPDYVSDLLAAVVEEVSARETGGAGAAVRQGSGPGVYPFIRFTRTPFTGGSDHYILSDPTVGVPCPAFIQFPDRFYHTSADTVDKVDPAMLGRVATAAATYAYFWAAAGPREAAWVAGLMTGCFAREVSRLAEAEVSRLSAAGGLPGPVPAGNPHGGAGHLSTRLAFLAERKTESLRALARVSGEEGARRWLPAREREVREAAVREEHRVAQLMADIDGAAGGLVLPADRREGGSPTSPASSPAVPGTQPWGEVKDLVPRRPYRGPLTLRGKLSALPKERRDAWRAFLRWSKHGGDLAAQLVYWMDGRRTLAEVVDCLELETGFRDEAFAAAYVALLAEADLIRLSG